MNQRERKSKVITIYNGGQITIERKKKKKCFDCYYSVIQNHSCRFIKEEQEKGASRQRV